MTVRILGLWFTLLTVVLLVCYWFTDSTVVGFVGFIVSLITMVLLIIGGCIDINSYIKESKGEVR